MKKKKKIRRRHIREKKGQIRKEETVLNECATATLIRFGFFFKVCMERHKCMRHTQVFWEKFARDEN